MLEIPPKEACKILEVGCGTARLIEHIQCSEYWGIEPNTEAFKIAVSKGCKAINGCFHEVKDKLPDQYFDLVIANHVIEHMPCHNSFFNRHSQKNVRFWHNMWISSKCPKCFSLARFNYGERLALSTRWYYG